MHLQARNVPREVYYTRDGDEYVVRAVMVDGSDRTVLRCQEVAIAVEPKTRRLLGHGPAPLVRKRFDGLGSSILLFKPGAPVSLINEAIRGWDAPGAVINEVLRGQLLLPPEFLEQTMDPDANLKEQLELVDEIQVLEAALDDFVDDGQDKERQEALRTKTSRLAELVAALNGWLCRGGFLPALWVGQDSAGTSRETFVASRREFGRLLIDLGEMQETLGRAQGRGTDLQEENRQLRARVAELEKQEVADVHAGKFL